MKKIEFALEEEYPEGITDGQLNNLFWFEPDYICQLLGYKDYEEFSDTDYYEIDIEYTAEEHSDIEELNYLIETLSEYDILSINEELYDNYKDDGINRYNVEEYLDYDEIAEWLDYEDFEDLRNNYQE